MAKTQTFTSKMSKERGTIHRPVMIVEFQMNADGKRRLRRKMVNLTEENEKEVLACTNYDSPAFRRVFYFQFRALRKSRKARKAADGCLRFGK